MICKRLKTMLLNSIGCFLTMSFLSPPLLNAKPVDNTTCVVLSNSDSVKDYHSLRTKLVEGFNRQEHRFCTELIYFGNKSRYIKLSKTLNIDNPDDIDCSPGLDKSEFCGDDWGLLLDGSASPSVVIDGRDLPDDQCVLRIRANRVKIKNIKILAKNPELKICDEGESNWYDLDEDGVGDAEFDNCIDISNPDQSDSDGDRIGDACDDHPLPSPSPSPMATPTTSPEPSPSPSDTPQESPSPIPTEPPQPTPVPTESPLDDLDADGVADTMDNCPTLLNPQQQDADQDGLGDDCDDDYAVFPGDDDGDGIANEFDNCENVVNPSQLDQDEDGIGDACDTEIKVQIPSRFSGMPDDLGTCSLHRLANFHPSFHLWVLLPAFFALIRRQCKKRFSRK